MKQRVPRLRHSGNLPEPAKDNWLDQLRADYRAHFPEKLAQLAVQVELVARARSARRTLAALRMEVHRLHGSSGTYGMSQASRVLGAWEKWLNRPQPPAGRASEKSLAALRNYLKKVARAAKKSD